MPIIRLTPAHATAYRALTLQTYACEPDVFTATLSEREPLPLEWWTTRLSNRPDPDELVFRRVCR